MGSSLIPCVVYAAKSTEDKRGSILTQITECQAAIEAAGERIVAGVYRDEAVSAYTSNRGPGLAEAMRHSETLASICLGAELWVQHSDRLARGDGKAARHVVEVALWANKTDVKIRSLQDADTFRDLLYAVVTGQRNHLDSQRKGASVSAGLHRAVARGGYAGICIDGYRVVVTVGPDNAVSKHLAIDPAREGLIRMIFAMAEDGRTPWETAEAVHAAGWTTPRGRHRGEPVRFEAWGILRVLRNPRYAGLSPWKGEILAPAHWPAYITPDAFEALRNKRIGKRRAVSLGPGRPRQPFLLVGVARCALCGSAIHAITATPRRDGTQRRTYVCAGHRHKHCQALPIDAAAVDSVFIEQLDEFLGGVARPPDLEQPAPPLESRVRQLKRRITQALQSDDLAGAGALFEELRRHREATSDGSPFGGSAPLRADILDGFHAWAASALDHPEKIALAETDRLRKILRECFHRVELLYKKTGFTMTAVPRGPASPQTIETDQGHWRLSSGAAGYQRRHHEPWTKEEILSGLHAWIEQHGEPPAHSDWGRATQSHPMANTVTRTFGSWHAGLAAAGCAKPRRRRTPPPNDRDRLGRYVAASRLN